MEKEKNYIVYIHTCKINNKKYVGVTCQKPSARWKNGGGYKRHHLFYEDIIKYGWQNFNHQIIAQNLNKDQAFQMQIMLIEQMNTTDERYGYNFSIGGMNSYLGKHLSDQAIQKNAEWHKQHPPEHYVSQLGAQKVRKAVKCIETGVVYKSIVQATVSCGGSAKSRCISQLLKGSNPHRHTAFGYHWQYVGQQVAS